MTNALVLTASSLGRTSTPDNGGSSLLVDGGNEVIIDVWPQPSRWVPEGLRLLRDGREVTSRAPGDDWRWILGGTDRFGTFRAEAVAGGRHLESAQMVVRPAVVTLPSGDQGQASGGLGFGSAGPRQTVSRSAARVPAPPTPAAPGPAPSAPATPAAPTGRAPATAYPASPVAPAPAASRASASAAPGPGPAPSAPATGSNAMGTRVPAHARPEDLIGVIATPVGQYDSRFATVVAALFAVLALAVLTLMTTRLLGGPDWFGLSTPPATTGAAASAPSPDGTTAERVGLGSSTVVLALGLVLTLAGAALAALEVRGRQQRHPEGPLVSSGPIDALRILPAILYRASQVPATIAVLFTAGLVLALGFIGQVYWAGTF